MKVAARRAGSMRGRGARLRGSRTLEFGAVLLGLIISYVLAVAVGGRLGTSLVLIIQIGTVGLALRAAHARRVLRVLAAGAMGLAAVAAVASLVSGGAGAQGAAFLAASLLYLVAPLSLLRWIVRTGKVDRQTLLAAIAAYFMIGMFFAFVYRAVGLLQVGPFFGAKGDGTNAQTLFFSFTTLTTTGYGNLVPEGNPGESVAVLEMLMGQLFLVTAVAKVITVWKPASWGVDQDAGAAPTEQPKE
jgi:ion channel